MRYRVCPDCGACLDPGEICDCRDKEKAASDGANIESGKEKLHAIKIAQIERKIKDELERKSGLL